MSSSGSVESNIGKSTVVFGRGSKGEKVCNSCNLGLSLGRSMSSISLPTHGQVRSLFTAPSVQSGAPWLGLLQLEQACIYLQCLCKQLLLLLKTKHLRSLCSLSLDVSDRSRLEPAVFSFRGTALQYSAILAASSLHCSMTTAPLYTTEVWCAIAR